MKSISKIAAAINPSTTMAIDAEVRRLKSLGVPVISFGAGEPDFNSEESVCRAGIDVITQGRARYTAAAGTPELRRAIAARLYEDYSLKYSENEICVSSGGKFAIFAAMGVLLDPGDEVILPTPCWVSYYEQIRMFGAVPVTLATAEENDLKLTADELRGAISKKTKLLVINNPGNPSGNVYTRSELEAIYEVCREADIYVLSDEMYAKLLYDNEEFTSFASLCPDAKARTVIVNGVSKAYAMTGWRIGFTVASEHISKAISSYLSHTTGCPSSVSQAAALEAFSGDQSYVDFMVKAYDERRRYLVERIKAIPSLSFIMPKGAFYMMINVEKFYGRTLGGRLIENDFDFSQALLDAARVAVTPGSAFMAPGYIRLCYAASLDDIIASLDRLESFLNCE